MQPCCPLTKPTEQPHDGCSRLQVTAPFLAKAAQAVQTGSQGDVALCRCLEVVLGCRQMLKTVTYSTMLWSDMHLIGLRKLFAFYSRTTCQIKLDEEYEKLYT